MNQFLKEIAEMDQLDRIEFRSLHGREIDQLRDNDKQRLKEVKILILSNQLSTSEDYYHAAIVFQHDDKIESIEQGYKLAMRSVELGYDLARRLAAAAFDRLLMFQGRPQKFGTQFIFDKEANEFKLWEVSPITTDEERDSWNVPPLTELIQIAQQFHSPGI